MSWPDALATGRTPTVEQIVLRLAFHIAARTRDARVAEVVLQRAKITRKTLARYACYRPDDLSPGDPRAAGPRRLDLYAAICLAMGENPGRVLWAATVSGDYPSMLALLHAEVHLRPRLLIADAPDAPDAAHLEMVALHAGSS